MKKLVDPWWEKGFNTITGYKISVRNESRTGTIEDELKYNQTHSTKL